MKKSMISLTLISLLVVSVLSISILHSHKNQSADAWKKLESVYQERIAILGPYIETARKHGVKAEELSLLNAAFLAAKEGIDGISEANDIKAVHQKQSDLTMALSRLVVSSVYPRLMTVGSFRALHEKLDEAEGRITRHFADYNRAVHAEQLHSKEYSHRIASIIDLNRKEIVGSAIASSQGDKVATFIPEKTGAAIVVNSARNGMAVSLE